MNIKESFDTFLCKITDIFFCANLHLCVRIVFKIKMADAPIQPDANNMKSSMEIWAASKFIGRECASLNKAFYLCKRDKGDEPRACFPEGAKVLDCGNKMIGELYAKHSAPYKAFQECLDFNDYRFSDCQKTEKALLDSWNSANKLKDFNGGNNK
jgi:hypothetical protein